MTGDDEQRPILRPPHAILATALSPVAPEVAVPVRDHCRHATLLQRLAIADDLGRRLLDVPGSWMCGLALRDCRGDKDPGCGRFEL